MHGWPSCVSPLNGFRESYVCFIILLINQDLTLCTLRCVVNYQVCHSPWVGILFYLFSITHKYRVIIFYSSNNTFPTPFPSLATVSINAHPEGREAVKFVVRTFRWPGTMQQRLARRRAGEGRGAEGYLAGRHTPLKMFARGLICCTLKICYCVCRCFTWFFFFFFVGGKVCNYVRAFQTHSGISKAFCVLTFFHYSTPSVFDISF